MDKPEIPDTVEALLNNDVAERDAETERKAKVTKERIQEVLDRANVQEVTANGLVEKAKVFREALRPMFDPDASLVEVEEWCLAVSAAWGGAIMRLSTVKGERAKAIFNAMVESAKTVSGQVYDELRNRPSD